MFPPAFQIFSFLKEKGKGFSSWSGLSRKPSGVPEGFLSGIYPNNGQAGERGCSICQGLSWRFRGCPRPKARPWQVCLRKLSPANPGFPVPCEKGRKKVSLKLAIVEFLLTFAPAFKAKFLRRDWKKIERNLKKDLRDRDKDLIFALRKTTDFSGSWGPETNLKNNLQKSCRIEKELYFCTRFERETRGGKIGRHVHRHIELTAVSGRDARDKEKESKVNRKIYRS